MIVNSVNSVLNNSVMQKITQMACQSSLIATIWYKLLKQFGNNTASGRVTLLVHYVTKGAFRPKIIVQVTKKSSRSTTPCKTRSAYTGIAATIFLSNYAMARND